MRLCLTANCGSSAALGTGCLAFRERERWTQATSEAEWEARHSNGAAILGGKLWVFGRRKD